MNPGDPPQGAARDGLGRLELAQPARGQGYRFSIDAVLLAHFVRPTAGAVADLGAGSGVISVLLAARGLAGPFTAVELDPLGAACCRWNFVRHDLPGLVLEHDLTQPHPALGAGGFALVVSNPPYTPAEHGRQAPQPSRARARAELSLPAQSLWAVAARLLAPGGRLVVCWPPRRLVEALVDLRALGLEPKRLRLVHGRTHLPAKIALIEAVKGGRPWLDTPPPLIIYDGPGRAHGPEVAAMYRELA